MKQLLQYLLAILLWIAAVIWAARGTPWLLLALIALHLVELVAIAYRTGRKFGIPAVRCIVLCMLFGFLWWLPLVRRMRADTLTEADFIEDGLEPWRERP